MSVTIGLVAGHFIYAAFSGNADSLLVALDRSFVSVASVAAYCWLTRRAAS